MISKTLRLQDGALRDYAAQRGWSNVVETW